MTEFGGLCKKNKMTKHALKVSVFKMLKQVNIMEKGDKNQLENILSLCREPFLL